MKPEADKPLSFGRKLLFAASSLFILANIYYAQSIIATIAADIGIDQSLSGLIVTITQAGYGLAVLFLVPLGDIVENKKLVTLLTLCSIPALLVAGLSGTPLIFLIATFFIGVTSCSVQILIPMGIGLAAGRERGTVAGVMMCAAIFGIVLARPGASWLTGLFGWRFVYLMAAAFMTGLLILQLKGLPLKPAASTGIRYARILRSMPTLLFSLQGLFARLCIMFLTFAAFTMFWSTTPIFLQARFAYSHGEVALFSLIGIVAPLCALLAGRMVDLGRGFPTTMVSMSMLGAAFILTLFHGYHILFMVTAVLLLDPGAHTTSVVMQQSVLAMTTEARSRLNALCIGFNISGGALGASLGPWLYSHFGWQVMALTGTAMAAAALILNLTLKRNG